MFRSQKSDAGSRLSRHSMDAWTRTPTLEDVTLMMDTAQLKKGMLVDVAIRREVPPVFVLTCQWEGKSKDPVWSLYEGDDGAKTCWTYQQSNLEMIYEIICMSLPGGVHTSAPSTLIGKGAMPPKKDEAAEAAAAAAAAQPAPPAAAPAPQPAPMQYPQGGPQGMPPQNMPPQNMPMYQQPMPGMPGYPPGYPQQGQPYPQGMPQQGMPQQGMPQQGMPQQGMSQQPGYPQGQPYPPNYPAGQPPYSNLTPGPIPVYQQGVPDPNSGAPSPTQMNNFVQMLDKGQKNLLLGHLFVEAGIMPEPCLEAALKLQELVRKGLISSGAAIEAMRKAVEAGGMLDDEIINSCRAQYPNDSLSNSVPVVKTAGGVDPREFIRQVIQLIQQAGIVTENDVATAEGVRKKHGGDVGTILVAAGKIERATLDAAKRCQPLVREHRLNHEEAYRILRHCQKNRSSVEEACAALSINIL